MLWLLILVRSEVYYRQVRLYLNSESFLKICVTIASAIWVLTTITKEISFKVVYVRIELVVSPISSSLLLLYESKKITLTLLLSNMDFSIGGNLNWTVWNLHKRKNLMKVIFNIIVEVIEVMNRANRSISNCPIQRSSFSNLRPQRFFWCITYLHILYSEVDFR